MKNEYDSFRNVLWRSTVSALAAWVVRALLPLSRAVVIEELARLAGDRDVLLAQQLVLRLQR